MPTQIDAAISTAKQEIAAAVDAKAITADKQKLSPLFRDEVQRHEMRYLDTFLSSDRHKSSSLTEELNSRTDNNSELGRTHTGTFSHVLNYQPDELSRIAKLMRPNIHHSPEPADCADSTTNDGNITSRKDGTTSDMTSSVHRQTNNGTRQTIAKSKGSKVTSKRPIPSINKRRQNNHRIMQKAKLKSHQVITSMIDFGKRCTLNASSLSNMIKGSVRNTALRIHALLLEDKNGYTCPPFASSTNPGAAVRGISIPARCSTAAVSRPSTLQSTNHNIPPSNVFLFSPRWEGPRAMKHRMKNYIIKSIFSDKNARS